MVLRGGTRETATRHGVIRGILRSGTREIATRTWRAEESLRRIQVMFRQRRQEIIGKSMSTMESCGGTTMALWVNGGSRKMVPWKGQNPTMDRISKRPVRLTAKLLSRKRKAPTIFF